MRMATEDTEIKEVTYHESMGNDEHTRNSSMEWLNKAENVFKKTKRRKAQVYTRKSWRMKHYTQENIRNKQTKRK